MERHLQKNGLTNFLLLLVGGIAGLLVSRSSHVLSGEVACVFLGVGMLIAGVSWFQMRLEEMERLEKLEFDELSKTGSSSKMFGAEAGDVLPARRSRELFEKYFVRGFTVFLFLLEGLGAWWLWKGLAKSEGVPMKQPLMAMALLGMFALVLFLIGKFSAGLAQLKNQRLLRPGASFLLLGAYFFGLTVCAIVAQQAGLAQVDLYLAHALCAVLALLAVENGLGLLLEIYRPRVKGQVGLLLYESRLVGLISHPESLFVTAAHALDYQFGFKVSETWFYQFLQRALSWIILLQLGVLVLSSSFVFIEPGEQALLERFGKPVAGRNLLSPGLHFKFPWPMDQVYRHRAEAIQSFSVGFEHGDEEHEEDDHGDAPKETTLLWTVAHYEREYHLLVASRSQITTNLVGGKKSPPVNLLSLSLPVQYQVTDLKAWVYNYENSAELLEDMATREVILHLASADMHELMSSGRFAAAQSLKEKIQAQADALKLGVNIVFVGLQDIHPPIDVASSFEEVVKARQDMITEVLNARAYAALTNGLARSEVLRITRESEAERRRLEVDALARASLFTNQIPAYLASPAVYSQRAYLETLAEGAALARKIILANTNASDVFVLNLEEKIRSDFFDVPMPTAKP